jgi:hypothetical protein
LQSDHFNKEDYEELKAVAPTDLHHCPFAEIGSIVKHLSSSPRMFALIMVTVLGFCLIVNNSWRVTPDSALYMVLGKSLATGQGYVFNGEPHTYVPPGYPMILAGTAKLLGDHFLSYRIIMALFGLLAAGLGYFFIYRMCGPDTALLAGGLFAVNHVLLDNATLTLSDVPFAFFVFVCLNAVLSLSVQENRVIRIALAGILTGLPPLLRINGLGVPPAAAVFLFCTWKDMKPLRRCLWITVFLLLSLAPFLLWQIWKASFPVSVSEGTYWDGISRQFGDQVQVVSSALIGYITELTYALTDANIRTGILELVIMAVTVLGAVIAFRRGERLLVPLTVIQFVGLLLSTAGSRYLIFLIPFLYLFLALGIVQLTKWISRISKRPIQPFLILIDCFIVLAVTNCTHNLITIYHCRTALEKNGAQSERSIPFFTTARWLKTHAPNARVLTTHSRSIHYLSGCRTIALVRSGVAMNETWVNTQDKLETLINETKPHFLFADSKNKILYNNIIKCINRLGLYIEVISEASPSERYHLYRILTK